MAAQFTPKEEKEIHAVFDFTLLLKGLHAAIEVIGGVILYIVSAQSILNIVKFVVADEVREDPHDLLANYLLAFAQHFGGGTQFFAAFYLLFHGIVNAFVVVELWREEVWAYPVSMAIIGAFIAYQLYLFIFSFSLWLALFTVVDVVILFLVWHEYGVLKKRRGKD